MELFYYFILPLEAAKYFSYNPEKQAVSALNYHLQTPSAISNAFVFGEKMKNR